jgi:hypothetical protein
MVNLWLEGHLLGIPNSQWKTIAGLKLLRVFNIFATLGFDLKYSHQLIMPWIHFVIQIPKCIITFAYNFVNVFCDSIVSKCKFTFSYNFVHLFCDAKPKQKRKTPHYKGELNIAIMWTSNVIWIHVQIPIWDMVLLNANVDLEYQVEVRTKNILNLFCIVKLFNLMNLAHIYTSSNNTAF